LFVFKIIYIELVLDLVLPKKMRLQPFFGNGHGLISLRWHHMMPFTERKFLDGTRARLTNNIWHFLLAPLCIILVAVPLEFHWR